jgi:hypothetical protein
MDQGKQNTWLSAPARAIRSLASHGRARAHQSQLKSQLILSTTAIIIIIVDEHERKRQQLPKQQQQQ